MGTDYDQSSSMEDDVVQATPLELGNAHLELGNDQDSRDQASQPSAPE